MQAKLDFDLLKNQLQQCPQYLISGVHPSATSEVAQVAVLPSWTSLPGHDLHAPVASDAEQPKSDLRHVDLRPRQHLPPPAEQCCQRPDPLLGVDAAVQPTVHDGTLQPPPAGALARPSKGAPKHVQDDMEDDLEVLLSKPAARHQKGKGSSRGFTPAHETSAAAKLLPPHPSRQPERKVNAKTPALHATTGRATNTANLEDWLDL